MTPRNFVYLAIAAALSVLFAVVSFASNNQWSTGRAVGAKLFPTLVSDASQIATVEVRQGDDTVVLERKGGSWGLKNRGSYPVDPSKVRTLLVGLAEADLIESKTRRLDRYAALELEDPAEKGAKSRIVRLLGAKGNVMGEVVIGKKRLDLLGTGKSGTYVRKPGDPQTWLANAELDASAAAKDWLKTSVFTTDAAKISRVTIEVPGRAAVAHRAPGCAGQGREGHQAVGSPRSRCRQTAVRGLPPDRQEAERRGRGREHRAGARLDRSWRTCASSTRRRPVRASVPSRSSRRTDPRRRCACARTAIRNGCRLRPPARARPRRRRTRSTSARRAGSSGFLLRRPNSILKKRADLLEHRRQLIAPDYVVPPRRRPSRV